MGSDPSDRTEGTAPDFTLDERWIERLAIVEVRGEVDMVTTPPLIERLDDVLAKSPAALIVDLSATSFLASAGINALLLARQKAGVSVRFAVVAEGSATSRPITLLGLADDLSLQPTLDEALAAVV